MIVFILFSRFLILFLVLMFFVFSFCFFVLFCFKENINCPLWLLNKDSFLCLFRLSGGWLIWKYLWAEPLADCVNCVDVLWEPLWLSRSSWIRPRSSCYCEWAVQDAWAMVCNAEERFLLLTMPNFCLYLSHCLSPIPILICGRKIQDQLCYDRISFVSRQNRLPPPAPHTHLHPQNDIYVVRSQDSDQCWW